MGTKLDGTSAPLYSGEMHFAERFEIDIVRALTEQLEAACDALALGPLDLDTIGTLEPEQGVYQLFRDQTLVYVGRARNLRSRLTKHFWKIAGRQNISTREMFFRCLYVHPNWTAMAPEDAMIRHYGAQGLAEWNGAGFGPNDPGRNREETDEDPFGFDAQFPIHANWTCDFITAGLWAAPELLKAMKAGLPLLLRYEFASKKRSKGHPDYNDVPVEVPSTGMPADELLALIARHLPGWQATVFPSHMILYRENRAYKHGRIIWPR